MTNVSEKVRTYIEQIIEDKRIFCAPPHPLQLPVVEDLRISAQLRKKNLVTTTIFGCKYSV